MPQTRHLVRSAGDEAVTHPHATRHLYRALADAGHLPSEHDEIPLEDVSGGRRHRVQRVRAEQLRNAPARRPSTAPAPQRQPQPMPQPGYDLTPQPGRAEPNPGHGRRLMP